MEGCVIWSKKGEEGDMRGEEVRGGGEGGEGRR